MNQSTQQKNGIYIRWAKGTSLRILSYAVFSKGTCQVSHETTAQLRKEGHDLQRLVSLEEKNGHPIA